MIHPWNTAPALSPGAGAVSVLELVHSPANAGNRSRPPLASRRRSLRLTGACLRLRPIGATGKIGWWRSMTSAPLALLIDRDIESRESHAMRMLFASLLCIMPICVMPSAALACMVTSDCAAGSRCAKPDGGIYGVCRGGISPGNANDRRPIQGVIDPNGTYGNTCRFDVDCGMSSKCVRRRSGVLGTCVGR